MPSYLGYYPHCAKHREKKFRKAVDSVLNQTYKNWELIIVSDACMITKDIVLKEYNNEERIKAFHSTPKQPAWSGVCRNIGLKNATGEWIAYLDTDDWFGEQHLNIISKHLTTDEWLWFNDYRLIGKDFRERNCDVYHWGMCGTSNIIHRKGIAQWKDLCIYSEDDFNFIKKLITIHRPVQIATPQYYVGHIPFKGGYDYD